MGNAKCHLELFLRIINVSLETMKIVAASPKLDLACQGHQACPATRQSSDQSTHPHALHPSPVRHHPYGELFSQQLLRLAGLPGHHLVFDLGDGYVASKGDVPGETPSSDRCIRRCFNGTWSRPVRLPPLNLGPRRVATQLN